MNCNMEHVPSPDARPLPADAFTIVIPTWNNLPYLRLCVDAIRRHSDRPHQIVLHVNDGSDGTLDWARAERLDFTRTPENTGICWGVNAARTLARTPFLLYMNDDMAVCPGWDAALRRAVAAAPAGRWCLSATMIEPYPTRSRPVVAPHDFGRSPDTFDEPRLHAALPSLAKPDWQGSTRPPVLVPVALWDLVGGYSVELSPGLYTDPDFTMKLWQAGIRHFRGVGDSLVYHFVSKTLSRLKPNDGRRQFLRKWGVSASVFQREILHLGEPWSGPLPERPDATPSLRRALFRNRLSQRFLPPPPSFLD
jgi:GT2 family glycosyltransferase